MTKEKINNAEKATREFLAAIKAVKESDCYDEDNRSIYVYGPSKEVATAKRRSMDLTNALAQFRKSDYS